MNCLVTHNMGVHVLISITTKPLESLTVLSFIDTTLPCFQTAFLSLILSLTWLNKITLCNVCSVHGAGEGVFCTSGGYHEYIGGYHEYIGGYHEYIGGITTLGDVQYIERYHDACGDKSLSIYLENPDVLLISLHAS